MEAVACQDYEDGRRRHIKANAIGLYKGRAEVAKRNASILKFA